MENIKETLLKFHTFLKANLPIHLYNNHTYNLFLCEYYETGKLAVKESLLGISDDDYFKKTTVILRKGGEKDLDSRYNNMLRRIDTFKYNESKKAEMEGAV